NNGDWFYVQAPANTSGTLTVAMQATGFSLLQPDVAVLDGGLTKVLGETASPYYNATATVTLTGVTPGEGFYIRCGSTTTMPGHGAYALQVNFGSSQQPAAVPAATTIANQPSQSYGSSSTDSTGGGLLGGLVGGLVQVVGGLLDHIVYGTLSGWGDALTVGGAGHPTGPPRHFAQGTQAVAHGHRHQPPTPHHGPSGHVHDHVHVRPGHF
ncbi:MAG TPA: hypothetical protein VG406_00845, partial [Isosphaeraceae bacterium]|nr:hypothetical protein [Isosphaeraceae bacterium]